MYLKSQLLLSIPGVVHGFGTKSDPIPTPFERDWQREKVNWRQVHGTGFAEALFPSQNCGEVDAIYTRQFKQPVAVITADCVPVLMARISGGAVVAVHAGWRGTRAHILREVWARLLEAGESPTDWAAALGPSIGPCCYEVSEELATDFDREFASAGVAVAVPAHRRLDLPAVNAAELRWLGLTQIEILRACTMCTYDKLEPRFNSFRREGGASRQYSMIMATRT